MEIIRIHFGHYVEKYSPWYWIPCTFCARIDSLQFGVVLVILLFTLNYINESDLYKDFGLAHHKHNVWLPPQHPAPQATAARPGGGSSETQTPLGENAPASTKEVKSPVFPLA